MRNKQQFFMQNRQIFMAGGPEGHETENKMPQTNPMADALEANAEGKPPVDLEKKVPGYPNDTPEVTDKNSAQYKKAKDELLPKLEAQLKKLNRAPRHGDVVGGTIDKHPTFLVIDENASPRERVFASKAEAEAAGQKVGEIPADVLKEKSKGYPEIKDAPAAVVSSAKETFKKSQGRDMGHLETATAFDAKDYEYVVLRDDVQKKDRVFKSPNPVPA